MRNNFSKSLAIAFTLVSTVMMLGAAEYRLANGNLIQGEVVSFDADGVVFRLESGGFSQRIHWATLDQESLKTLAESDPEARALAELYIEVPPEEIVEPEPIAIRDVPRVPRVTDAGLTSAFTTPMGLFLLLVVVAASGYAGFEAARYRHQPRIAGAVVSVVLPIVGPIIFLALPTGHRVHDEVEEEYEEPVGEPKPAAPPGGGPPPPPGSAAGLSLSGGGDAPAAAGGKMREKTYKRGGTTFNRKFFEATFPGFFRIVPGEAEKDMVLAVKAGKHEVVGKRITRISSNEVHLQLLSGGEKSVVFNEIQEVQVRHKDAKR